MKKLFTILFLMLFLFLMVYFFNTNSSEIAVDSARSGPSHIISGDENSSSYFSKDFFEKNSRSSVDNEYLNIPEILKKRDEERQHLGKIGYYSPDEEAVYQSYSVDVLEELLFAGDIYAYPPLIEKYSMESDREKIIVASRIAAVYGSTPAILMSAGQELGIAQITARQGDKERADHHAVISKGLFRLASLLGDPYAEEQSDMSFKGSGIELSEEYMIQAELAADKFRGELNELRRRQGLDEL